MIAKIFAIGSVAAMFLAGCCDKQCEDCSKNDVKSAAVPVATAADSRQAESRDAATLAEQSKQTVLPERPQEPLSLWNDHAPAKDSLEAFVRQRRIRPRQILFRWNAALLFSIGMARCSSKPLRRILTGCFSSTAFLMIPLTSLRKSS